MTVRRLLKYRYIKFVRNHVEWIMLAALFLVFAVFIGGLLALGSIAEYSLAMVKSGQGSWYHVVAIIKPLS